MIFVHIGAGVGDLDPSTNFRDGFSEYVKKIKNKKKDFCCRGKSKKYRKIKKMLERL